MVLPIRSRTITKVLIYPKWQMQTFRLDEKAFLNHRAHIVLLELRVRTCFMLNPLLLILGKSP
jgi:hypothetical protein